MALAPWQKVALPLGGAMVLGAGGWFGFQGFREEPLPPPSPETLLSREAPSETSLEPISVPPLYELWIGDRVWPVPGSVDIDGQIGKVIAADRWVHSSHGISFEHASSLVVTTASVNGKEEWTLFSPDGHRARIRSASADTLESWRQELQGMQATPAGSTGLIVQGASVPGERWAIPGWIVSLHAVRAPQPLVVGLYVAENQPPPTSLLTALSTLSSERTPPVPFTWSDGTPMPLEQPVELTIGKQKVPAVIRRKALVPRSFSGLTFEHRPSLVATEQHNPLLPSVLLSGDRHSVQWVVSSDLRVAELTEALATGVPGVSMSPIRRDFGGRRLDGTFGKQLSPPATVEVYAFEFGGRSLGMVLQYAEGAEADAMRDAQSMLLTLR